ncbi:hypothetical protein BDD12DRAFT_813497 [Trichophaea hybrida]|nr:hypothetical protein BDD12DRAFT_813497 [Trichophaea hybrida]
MNRLFLRPPRALLRPRCCSTISQQSHRTDRPLRLAVIGAGPAGFYTSYRVLSKLSNAYIDMYESLPVPYGLVRFGVAPDHPEVKNCQDKFNEVAESPRFTYIGNTPIGTSWSHPPHRSLPLSSITPHYDAILLSYGASKDRKLGIEGEDTLSGVYSARAFVGWYNGLPEYAGFTSKLFLDSAEEVVVIGQGNVALDSRVKRVRVVGRRGPLQAAFTVKELRELLSMPGLGFPGVDSSLIPADAGKLPRQQKRIVQILQKGSNTLLSKAQRQWELNFLRSPTAFLPSTNDPTTLGAVRFDKTLLEKPIFSTTSRAVPTGEFEDLQADMAFRSIGYLSEPISGFEEAGIPFNSKRGLVPNEDGRVVKPSNAEEPGEVVPGVYTSGWVKRGPTGVIASTMYDAFETADAIVNDWVTGEREFMNAGDKERRGWEAVQGEVRARGMRPVNWAEWQRIDAAEKERGARSGKEREKFL